MVSLSRPRRRAAGGGAGRGRAAGRDVARARQLVRGRRTGASALAAALDRGALPLLKTLILGNAAIGDAGLVALAPALRRRPAVQGLHLHGNPFGDEGLAALVAPPPADAPPPQAEVLAKLEELNLMATQITDDGCAHLASRLRSGALPALEYLYLNGISASDAVRDAVYEAHPGLH